MTATTSATAEVRAPIALVPRQLIGSTVEKQLEWSLEGLLKVEVTPDLW